MQVVYTFDNETKIFDAVKVVADDYELQENETLVQPTDEDGTGMYEPKWDYQNQKWVGLTKEEFDKKYPPEQSEPSEDDQQDAQTMLLIANLTQQIQEQQKLNAQMMLQIADLTKKVQQ